MAAMAVTCWNMSLRCHSCHSLFTIKGIPSTSLAATADETVCPDCGAGAEPAALGPPGYAKHHLIVNLEKERR